MKKYVFCMLLLGFTTVTKAQQNLREGYVITLQGDTLRGVIDYRASSMNTKRCMFKQDGETDFKEYHPGEIDGYRFINNGIYYVSKRVRNEEGIEEMLFAEYVLHGNINLYQLGNDKMVLEDEDGNLASFSIEKAREANTPKELRNELNDALKMFQKSENATSILWNKSKNRDNTKKAVIAYVDEACPNGYCEAYEYKSKSTPKEDRDIHLWVKAGMKYTQYKYPLGREFSSFSPRISFGTDFHFNRVLKGLMATAGFSYESAKHTRDVNKLFAGEPSSKLDGSKMFSVKYNQLDLIAGVGYQKKTGPVKTYVKAGGILRLQYRNMTDCYATYRYRGTNYSDHVTIIEEKYKFDNAYGLFGGIGVEYPLKHFSLICDLEYIFNTIKGVSSILLTESSTVKQHGYCLSVGVKF